MALYVVADLPSCLNQTPALVNCHLHCCWRTSDQRSLQTYHQKLVLEGLAVGGRRTFSTFQLVVADMMAVVVVVVFAAVEACKTFAVETEPGDIYAASVAVERHCNPEEAFAFDFPSSEPVQ